MGQVAYDNDNEDGDMSWFLMMILLLIGKVFMKPQVVREPRIYTRRKTNNKRKQSPSGGIFIGSYLCF